MMSTATAAMQVPEAKGQFFARGRVGMVGLIAAESTIFTIFVVAYLFYLGKSSTGPTPKEVLEPPILYTICLLSSSVTIYAAIKRLRQGHAASFAIWWLATIALSASTARRLAAAAP